MESLRIRKRLAPLDAASIDLRRLRHFLAVCDHGGIQRAADAIGVAQPTITRQIRLLEEELGQVLLVRDGRRARPSEAGRFLVAKSRTHMDGLDATLRDLWQTFCAAVGPVILGICPSIAPLFVDDLHHYVRSRFPNLKLSVLQAHSGDLRNLFRFGHVDIALTCRGSLGQGFSSEDLFSERLVLVCGANKRTLKDAVPVEELASLNLILPGKGHELRAIVDEVCASRGIELAPALELDSLDLVKSMMLDDISTRYAILPYHSVQREIASDVLGWAEISDPAMARTVALVVPEASRNADAVECIGARVRDRVRELKAKLPTLL